MVIECPGAEIVGRLRGHGIRLRAIQGCRFANSDRYDRTGTRHQFDDILVLRYGRGNVGAVKAFTWAAAAAADQRGAQTRAQPAKAPDSWTGLGHQNMTVLPEYGMPFRGKRTKKELSGFVFTNPDTLAARRI